jgi:hypothetical protein
MRAQDKGSQFALEFHWIGEVSGAVIVVQLYNLFVLEDQRVYVVHVGAGNQAARTEDKLMVKINHDAIPRVAKASTPLVMFLVAARKKPHGSEGKGRRTSAKSLSPDAYFTVLSQSSGFKCVVGLFCMGHCPDMAYGAFFISLLSLALEFGDLPVSVYDSGFDVGRDAPPSRRPVAPGTGVRPLGRKFIDDSKVTDTRSSRQPCRHESYL